MFTNENRWPLHMPGHDRYPALLLAGAQDGLARARMRFAEQFQRLHAQARRHSFWAMVTRRRRNLLCLEAVRPLGKVAVRSQQRPQLVPIDQIRGSEGRCSDFDAEFRPLKSHEPERWINIAIAHSRGATLPPVQLVQVNQWYYVRDGHHRISVAKTQGQMAIEAEVVVWG